MILLLIYILLYSITAGVLVDFSDDRDVDGSNFPAVFVSTYTSALTTYSHLSFLLPFTFHLSYTRYISYDSYRLTLDASSTATGKITATPITLFLLFFPLPNTSGRGWQARRQRLRRRPLRCGCVLSFSSGSSPDPPPPPTVLITANSS